MSFEVTPEHKASQAVSSEVWRARLRSVALVGAFVALLAISAQITVPIGPVPVTLQTAVLILTALVLTPREAIATIVSYIAAGALGAPVFSAGRSGIAALLGPTGGFLYGFIIAMIIAVVARQLVLRAFDGRLTATGLAADENVAPTMSYKQRLIRSIAGDATAALIIIAVSYVFGAAHLMVVANLSLEATLAAAVYPFVAIDLLKGVIAHVVAQGARAIQNRQN